MFIHFPGIIDLNLPQIKKQVAPDFISEDHNKELLDKQNYQLTFSDLWQTPFESMNAINRVEIENKVDYNYSWSDPSIKEQLIKSENSSN